MKKNLLCGFLAVMFLVASSLTVYGNEEYVFEEDTTYAPYFLVDDKKASFPLKETDVTANITGVIADIYVVQTYVNDGNKPINANYVFPASTRATVHGMKMEIGDNIVIAQIKQREEAKEEYQEAKDEGKSASLLEEQRPNVFTMSIANIMPGDTVRVELHFTELVNSTEGVYQFVFPTIVGPRYSSSAIKKEADTNKWVASAYIKDGETVGKYNITVNLSTGVPITGLTSKSHEITVVTENESEAHVTLSNPNDFAGNRDYILEYKLTGQEVNAGLMIQKGEDENFFMLTVQPPERSEPADSKPREYIFVLDKSGSMDGYPLETAKELIKNLVNSLSEKDSFNLILFSDEMFLMSAKSVAATEKNLSVAVLMIEREYGGGGTEFIPALKAATKIPMESDVLRSIITITDGYISEEREAFNIIDKNLKNTNYFSFGVGTAVNRYLIDGIARKGMGESFVVAYPSDVDGAADLFRACVENPVLTDIKIEYNGFDAYDVQPAINPTLYTERPIVIYGKWRGELDGIINISGKSGNNDYTKEIKLSEIKQQHENKAISYMWARKKVEELTDYYGQADTEKQITEIGLKYSMLTPYTSFIAVIDTVRNIEKQSTDVDQPLPLPLNVSNLAVGGYTVGSEPTDLIIVFGMVALVLAYKLVGRLRKKEV